MSKKQTANKAVEILVSKNVGFQEPSASERRNLAVAFAKKNMVLYGRAFDVIKCNKEIDFSDEKSLLDNLEDIFIYEVKSTNRKNVKKDFTGYFFDLTTAELLVAQSLRDQYKFAFVNTITEEYVELTINQVFAKAKRVYPKWAITF